MTTLKVNVIRKPTIKVKVLPNFPSSVTVTSPILLSRVGGNYAFSLDPTSLVNALTLTGDVTSSGSATTIVNAWKNTRLAKTANYTVVNANKWSTIALGGSAFFTLTFSAASGYDANFAVMVLNEDTGRGKTLAINGLTSFILWPGQSCLVFNQNNVWKVGPSFQRWLIPGGFAGFNVDTALGNDTNDGLATGAGAFLTIAQAVAVCQNLIDCNSISPTINVSGTVTEQVNVTRPLLNGQQIFIIGNSTPGQQVSWTLTNSQTAVQTRDGGICTVRGFNFSVSGSGNTFLSSTQAGVLDYQSCIFGVNTGGIDINIDQGGACNSLDTTGTSSTVTITNASPAVISWAAHGLIAGAPIFFTTTGGLPTGLAVGTIYYVISAGLLAGSFQVSTSVGGSAVNTSSAGSGTHTAYANDSGYQIKGNRTYHVNQVGPSKYNMAGARVYMPSALTLTNFVRLLGSGGTINWGLNTFVGPGSAAGTTGTQYAVSFNAVFFLGGSTVPGASAGGVSNGGIAA